MSYEENVSIGQFSNGRLVRMKGDEANLGAGIVAYDFLFCQGGAERVTLTLAKGIPGTDVCVAFRNRRAFPESSITGFRCRELFRYSPMKSRALRTVAGMWAFRYNAGLLERYDWAVFSGSRAPVAVRHRNPGRNIYYCHTIPRFAYDLYEWYYDSLYIWQRPAFRMFAYRVRCEYESALARMDRVLANSANVSDRLRRYLGIDAPIVNPPCDSNRFRWCSDGEYYLSTARLERLKRVDVIIEAFREMPDRTLIVASGGGDEARLRRLALGCENIRFVGWQSEEQLQMLMGSALATIYLAKDEDFGMSPVESMAAGKPVIGVDEGGVRETVIDGETGVLVSPDPDADSLISAVRSLSVDDARGMRAACECRAALFRTGRFLDRMNDIIASTA